MEGFEADVDHPTQPATDTAAGPLRDVVVDLSTNLMSAAPDEFDTKLEWEVRRVADQLDVDRGYVFVDDDGFDLAAEHADGLPEWTALGRSIGEFDWAVERVGRFENAVVDDVADLPPEAADFRECLRSAGVRSVVLLPVVSDWTLAGVLGFDAARRRDWSEDTVNRLRSVAELVGHSLSRVRRERELRRQNERLDAFASTVSHDLRNPLAAATGAVELARARDETDHLDRATDALDRMDRLIDRILTLARAGREVGETRRVDLTHAVDASWTTVDPAGLRLDAEADLGTVEADPERLREALENLFRNCAEHGPDEGVVSVGTLDDGRGLYVADDGPGFDGADMDSLFEQGYSAGGGTGLGLAIVREVVEAHGWTIRATTPADGGARFELEDVSFVD